MDIIELLDKCKEVLDIKSDYALAKALDINQSRLTAYRKMREHPDTFVCFKIAEVLGESPSKIIASVESISQRNPDKALFFKHFLTSVGLWITLAVIPLYLGSHLKSAQAAGISEKCLFNQTYKAIIRSSKTIIKWVKSLVLGKEKRRFLRILYV